MGRPRWGNVPSVGFVGPAVAVPAGVAFEVGTGFVITEGGGAAAGGIIGGTLIEEGAVLGGSALFVPLLGAAAALVAGFAIWYVFNAATGGWSRVNAGPLVEDGSVNGYAFDGDCNPNFPGHNFADIARGWRPSASVACFLDQGLVGTSLLTFSRSVALNPFSTNYARSHTGIGQQYWDTLKKFHRTGTAWPVGVSQARTKAWVDTTPALREAVSELTQPRVRVDPRADPKLRLRPYEREASSTAVDFPYPEPSPSPEPVTVTHYPNDPYVMVPPGRKTREKKVFIRGNAALVRLLDLVTESQDLIDCAVRNVHPWRRVGRYWTNKPIPPYAAGNVAAKASYVWENIHTLDVGGFVACLAVNAAEDLAIGKLSKAANSAWIAAGRHVGLPPTHGVGTGPWDGKGLGGVPRPTF